MRNVVQSIVYCRGAIVILLVLLFCAASLLHVTTPSVGRIGAMARVIPNVYTHKWAKQAPPIDTECRQQLQMPCYSPKEMQKAYGLTSVLNEGFVGVGQTIVIIDSFGSPTVEADLKQFSRDYGLPDPPSFKVISPLGTVPFDINNADQVGWAQETNLDVQWAHAIAPGANIVLLTSPVSETQGVQGMPEFLKLLEYAVDNNLGQIISQSWGTTEGTLYTPEGKKVLNDFNRVYEKAARKGITVFASAGDAGTANPDVKGRIYPFPTVSFPASSPWVTAVGGTSLMADTEGNYQSEVVWNRGIGSATGGGYSYFFKEPFYQRGVLDYNNSRGYRGLPDIAYNGDPTTSVPVYLGFMQEPGYFLFGGTSAGAPQWAGIIANANQKAGRPMGFLNDKLYKLGRDKTVAATIFNDITKGSNEQGHIRGFSASAGWDATTGWGTPKAKELIAALLAVK